MQDDKRRNTLLKIAYNPSLVNGKGFLKLMFCCKVNGINDAHMDFFGRTDFLHRHGEKFFSL